ncbi:dTDP-glucose 4,6-dehydratase [Candidatus Kaiserbacteria bacterium RIFCSPHIGHO2_01_FULL_53_29]|uniref:dTDP-glucose 4,6-dehydratase n=1 Tax=Candidatus Kaiserbacteria bacterium RIFCSPHIGHO2_01_FULL_53_29 TaxID=1798480 RepID=A0A1F6CXC2_9BACT|nr:MAG: dTDP-glucose 4,6-dehydratase [Candidatus Kaiserbacteria bacterium RIFCSPHIGHO2_01_FULL_53_29]
MRYKKIILVTGGAGFIGGAYLNTMVLLYPRYRFINLDALTYAADRKNLKIEGEKNYVFVKADIRDQKRLRGVFEKYRPTHVIHFAAESHVDNAIASPHVFVETNVLGTLNLLDLARTYRIKRFHHISTDEVYGSLSLKAKPVSEDAPLRPSNPYSASKAAADCFVLSYHNTHGLNTVITRSSNNYGSGQHKEKLIPLFIHAFKGGRRAPLYGSGIHVRDWIYVGDNVEGIDRVFHKGKSGEVYNLGGGNEMRNIDVAKKLLALIGNRQARVARVKDRPGHDLRYALNSAKARKLGWHPKVTFDKGLLKTIAQYLKR